MKPSSEELCLPTFLNQSHIEAITPHLCKQPFKQNHNNRVISDRATFQCHPIHQETHLMDGKEFKEYFVYVFGKNNLENSQIIVYSIQKKNGVQIKTVFKDFNGTISCLKLQLYYSTPPHSKANLKTKYKVLAGGSDGFIRILDLQKPYFTNHIKLDTKAVISILQGNYQRFNDQNICMALTSDSQVYFIDLDIYQVLYVLKPKLIMCDTALSIDINPQQTHLMQTTEGGYVILWDLDAIVTRLNVSKKIDKNAREYGMFPFCCEHSSAIQGLLWCNFYGNMVIMVTKEGELKIIAYLFGNETEHLELLSYKLQHPESITHFRFFPHQDLLMFSHNHNNTPTIQQLKISSSLTISKIRNISINEIDQIRDFYLTDSFNIMLCRSNRNFVLNQCEEFFTEEIKNKSSKQEQQ